MMFHNHYGIMNILRLTIEPWIALGTTKSYQKLPKYLMPIFYEDQQNQAIESLNIADFYPTLFCYPSYWTGIGINEIRQASFEPLLIHLKIMYSSPT